MIVECSAKWDTHINPSEAQRTPRKLGEGEEELEDAKNTVHMLSGGQGVATAPVDSK